jgi:DNA-binding NarL/FixJ family response regulator
MSEKIRVMLVDDHATFREPLAIMLGWEEDMEVVAQSGSLAGAHEIVEDGSHEIDVAVVDLELPDGSGTEIIKALRDDMPKTMSLVLSSHSEERHLAEAVEAGAAGVVHKSSGPGEVVAAIRRLNAGEALLSPEEVIEALRFVVRERAESHEASRMIESLTPRELEVLECLAEGLSDREMAEKLYVVPGTIRAHLTKILTKLEVDSRLQALLFAVRHGLVNVE